jgi:hypothetical protein
LLISRKKAAAGGENQGEKPFVAMPKAEGSDQFYTDFIRQ